MAGAGHPEQGDGPPSEREQRRGVAAYGLDWESDEGRALVGQALAAPEQLSQNMEPEAREMFLQQFEVWQRLYEQVTQ